MEDKAVLAAISEINSLLASYAASIIDSVCGRSVRADAQDLPARIVELANELGVDAARWHRVRACLCAAAFSMHGEATNFAHWDRFADGLGEARDEPPLV